MRAEKVMHKGVRSERVRGEIQESKEQKSEGEE